MCERRVSNNHKHGSRNNEQIQNYTRGEAASYLNEWRSIYSENMKTIEVSWANGKLIAHCDKDSTLNSNVIDWPEPISGNSDSWAIAGAVTEINGAEIFAVDHDKEFVFVHVNGEVCE